MRAEIKKFEDGFILNLETETPEECELLTHLWERIPDITFEKRGCISRPYSSHFSASIKIKVED